MLAALCESPRSVLKRQKHSTKSFPVNWGKHFCANFLTYFYILVERENDCKNPVERKRSLWKVVLPTTANHLLKMVQDAISKVENDSGFSSEKRRKRNTTTTSESLLIKNRPASTNFIEVTEEIIEQNLMCPLCNHKSIIALTKKEYVEYANQQIRMNFERRMKKEWKK